MSWKVREGAPARARILILVPHYPPAFLGGGPARTIEAMVRNSARSTEACVLTSDTDHGALRPLDVPRNEWTHRDGTRVWYATANNPQKLLRAFIASSRSGPEYVYINSLFNPLFSILPLMLHRMGLWRRAQIVLAPRGEADPGALKLKTQKKMLYLRFARRLHLFRGVLWHASGRLEAMHLKQLGLEGEVLVKENETLLPPQAHIPTRGDSSSTELLYVGRIAPKKQIELLIGGLLLTKGEFTLHVVGDSVDQNYDRFLREIASPIGDRVVWHGPADRDSVFQHFDRSHMLCLPTAGENFGHVIAESLSRSCPVMVMDVTPWTEVIAGGGGIVVPNATVEAWSENIQGLLDSAEGHAQRRKDASRAYDSWRASVDEMSFLDHLLDRRDVQEDAMGT